MKFIHMGDCHLGGWRQPELKELNYKSFQFAIDKAINEKVEFVLITGDLFDSAYPPIEILKETFKEFRRLKDEKIPVFIISGSHDYSASGKTFLDVLEKAGFCTNVARYEERDNRIILLPTIYKGAAIYGFSGKKSGLEVEEIEKIKLQESPGLFSILMLHTAIKDAVPTLPIKSVDQDLLPKVDYLALGHLHINYNYKGRVYSGPTFPNNLSELEELQGGSFYIIDHGHISKQEIKIKQILIFNKEIKNALTATEEILSLLESKEVKDKVIILKLHGVIENGKIGDIDFAKIEQNLKKRECYVFLRSTSKLHIAEPEFKMEILDSTNLENQIIQKFIETNPNPFNNFIPELIETLQTEKLEDEKLVTFEERLISETRRVLKI